jgi:proteasome lid subunit RPN8/RPN11
MRRLGIEILAIYHSHPTSEPVPSRTDLARNYYEEAIHFIISLQSENQPIRAWWLAPDRFREAEWEVREEG